MASPLKGAKGKQRALGKERGWVFVVSGPSGGGKTTVIERLKYGLPALKRSVSVTTRLARRGERKGDAYRFVTQAQFSRMRREGQFLEWAKVHGACYGTPRLPIVRALARGQDTILSIDVQGARKVRRLLGKRAVLVFLLPPSLERLKKRLRGRGTERYSAVCDRLSVARKELECAKWYDYAIVNDKLEDAVKQLMAIILARQCQVVQEKRRR